MKSSSFKRKMHSIFGSDDSDEESCSDINNDQPDVKEAKYLDENLMTYKELSYKTNFERFLKLIWVRLVAEIEINLKKDDTVLKIKFLSLE
jgi:hypothetical protein